MVKLRFFRFCISTFIVALVCFTVIPLVAQNDTVHPKYKTVNVIIPKIKPKAKSKTTKISVTESQRTSAVKQTDSLSTVESFKSEYDKLKNETSARQSLLAEADTKIEKQAADINKLLKAIDSYKTIIKETEQQNLILIIFNGGVGIFLVITLIWLLWKPSRKKIKPANGTKAPSKPKTFLAGTHNPYLEQLERLGKLKEQGVLTDEEFSSQKQFIIRDS